MYLSDMQMIYGENRLHITKPTMKGKQVLAWGGIECSDKKGLNIVLVHSESDEYGDWYLLKNTHSSFLGIMMEDQTLLPSIAMN